MTPETPTPHDFIERIRHRLRDRYVIERELLGGGMSRVFIAREIALDRTVVIKFLPPEIAADANRERFRREIQMAARLSHPHIAPLFSAAEDGELLYYTMPFIAGESLRHSLDVGRRFSVSETIGILKDVADALAYAHKAGIVHRDIKPANVLREGDHAVITDFGVAKAVSFALGLDSRPSVATTSGMAIGTPAYMAPEQIAGDISADHRVDIYAFGLLGYELLTGHAPFRAPSPQAQLAAQLTQPPPPIAEKRPDVPPVLAALLARCLEKDASHRPASAESVLEVLRAVSSTSGGVHHAYAPSSTAARLRQGLPVAAALAAAALLWIVMSQRASVTAIAPAPTDTAVQTAPAAAPAPLPPAAPEFSRAQQDSLRMLSDQYAQREQRLIALLRDSISNAVHRSVADSIVKVRETELAEQRVRDSVGRASRMTTSFTMPPNFVGNVVANAMAAGRGPIPPEAFAVRAQTLGPARRVGVSIFSGVRNAPTVVAASIVRDSIIARLRGKSRFIVVPPDSIGHALSQSRNLDSVRTGLQADMWVTIYASGSPASDSLKWDVTIRDFGAHTAFSTNAASTRKVAFSAATEPGVVSPLAESVVRSMDMMDRAPRKGEAPSRRGTFVKPQ